MKMAIFQNGLLWLAVAIALLTVTIIVGTMAIRKAENNGQ
jgi:hypothetical protein